MAKFFSASTGGFYDDKIHRALPADAVPISDQRHLELLEGQSSGKIISADASGAPRLLNPPARPIAERRRLAIRFVKREAERRILAVAPIWRQLNDARDLPASAGDRRQAIEARFAAIDAIRAASDAIEARIAGMGAADLAAFDPAADHLWKGTDHE